MRVVVRHTLLVLEAPVVQLYDVGSVLYTVRVPLRLLTYCVQVYIWHHLYMYTCTWSVLQY